jgi:hypothetical protein
MNQTTDLFARINNAVLDLQAAEYQTFQKPLKDLGRLMRHEDLASINNELTQGLDIEKFLNDQGPRGGMVGSDVLDWPDNPETVLGLTWLLIQKFAEDPDFFENFGHTYFNSDSKIISGIRSATGQLIIPFARDYKYYVMNRGRNEPKLIRSGSNKVFIVHGHDDAALEGLARFLEKLKLEVIILKEQPNQGRTIIEKFEQSSSEVGFAVVLMTPDDIGAAVSASEQNSRARQNVVFELGYFVGKLGRGCVCLLKKGAVEIPSDLFGVVYTDMDPAGGWKQALVMELKAANLDFDANRLWGV